ncbi:MAG: EamA family transporter RarD [Spirochaetia bacterium]|jgi:chloramphenicol-sensitive protein RarD|nr:EamA family transporter RarD [Spirochaetia bacterium]
MKNSSTPIKGTENDKSGYIQAFFAYVIWGFLPIYWKFLKHIMPLQIMINRIIWCFVFLFIITLIKKKNAFVYLKNFKTLMIITAASIMLSVNWFIYIFAVNSGRILEASMGYYINPLVSIALGLIVFREKLNRLQSIALAFASAGVLYMTIDYGKFPYISVFLAVSFALYGLFKKYFSLDSLTGLMTETMTMTPIGVAVIIYFQFKGTNSLFTVSPLTDLLLIGAGVVTAVPLLLFAEGAKKIPLSSIGFLQYIAPTLMLLTGVFIYGEEFTISHLITFSFIWTGLAIYTYSLIKPKKKIKV